MMQNDKIKDIFASKLNSFEVTPPVDMWARIDKSLSGTSVPKPRHASTLRLKIVATLVAVAASVAILFTINWGGSSKIVPVKDSPLAAVPKNEINTSESVVENRGSEPKTSVVTSKVKVNRVTSKPNFVKPSSEPLLAVTKSEEVLPSKEGVQETSSSPQANTAPTRTKEEIQQAIARFEEAAKTKDRVVKTRYKKKNNISLGLDGRFFAQNGAVHQTSEPVLSSFLPKTFTANGQGSGVVMSHHFPIAVGLKIAKQLTPSISIESGLVYTYLSSTVKSTNPSSSLKLHDQQTFHYIGLPLSMNYQFAQCNKVKFYVSAGAMIEKDFFGALADVKVHQDHPQFSTMFALGISYPLHNNLCIYTNFGASYYFEAHNKYQTVYSDQKIQPNLSLGLKFELNHLK